VIQFKGPLYTGANYSPRQSNMVI